MILSGLQSARHCHNENEEKELCLQDSLLYVSAMFIFFRSQLSNERCRACNCPRAMVTTVIPKEVLE